MTTVEHALPVPTLYEDVLTLYALSGTGSTPTHIVNYGGAWGEQLVWATEDIPNDPKSVSVLISNVLFMNPLPRLRRFTKHDILQGLTESSARPANCVLLEAFFVMQLINDTFYSIFIFQHIGVRCKDG